MRNPYEVLGVPKGASAKDIKSAFRKLAKQFHPDQNPDNPKAQERFAAVNQAYEILGDEEKRGAFDRGEIDGEGKPRFQGFEGMGAGADPFASFRRGPGTGGARWEFRSGSPNGAGDAFASDIFSEIFGEGFRPGSSTAGMRRAPQRGGDIAATLDVSIEEAATGARVNALFPNGKHIAVKLPDYVEDGQTIRLKGQGEPGPAGPGDALVTLRFKPHPRFRLEGRDIHADIPLPLQEAVIGGKVPVDTPTGRIAVTVPPWSSSDKVLRLKGKGMPEKGGGRGEFYAHLRIMLPEGGDRELEALMRREAKA